MVTVSEHDLSEQNRIRWCSSKESEHLLSDDLPEHEPVAPKYPSTKESPFAKSPSHKDSASIEMMPMQAGDAVRFTPEFIASALLLECVRNFNVPEGIATVKDVKLAKNDQYKKTQILRYFYGRFEFSEHYLKPKEILDQELRDVHFAIFNNFIRKNTCHFKQALLEIHLKVLRDDFDSISEEFGQGARLASYLNDEKILLQIALMSDLKDRIVEYGHTFEIPYRGQIFTIEGDYLIPIIKAGSPSKAFVSENPSLILCDKAVFIRHAVDPNGDCGYTAIKIDREEAYLLLCDNIVAIRDIVKPIIGETLSTNVDFVNSLSEDFKGVKSDSQNYIAALRRRDPKLNEYENNLTRHCEDLNLIKAYIDYDVKDRRIDSGWCHPLILYALAHIKGINLRLYEIGDEGKMVAHRHFPEYIPDGAKTSVQLLFINGNHFERVEERPEMPEQPAAQNLNAIPVSSGGHNDNNTPDGRISIENFIAMLIDEIANTAEKELAERIQGEIILEDYVAQINSEIAQESAKCAIKDESLTLQKHNLDAAYEEKEKDVPSAKLQSWKNIMTMYREYIAHKLGFPNDEKLHEPYFEAIKDFKLCINDPIFQKGNTLLHEVVAAKRSADAVMYLLDLGADMFLLNRDDESSLDIALETMKDNPKVYGIMCEVSLNVIHKNLSHSTAGGKLKNVMTLLYNGVRLYVDNKHFQELDDSVKHKILHLFLRLLGLRKTEERAALIVEIIKPLYFALESGLDLNYMRLFDVLRKNSDSTHSKDKLGVRGQRSSVVYTLLLDIIKNVDDNRIIYTLGDQEKQHAAQVQRDERIRREAQAEAMVRVHKAEVEGAQYRKERDVAIQTSQENESTIKKLVKKVSEQEHVIAKDKDEISERDRSIANYKTQLGEKNQQLAQTKSELKQSQSKLENTQSELEEAHRVIMDQAISMKQQMAVHENMLKFIHQHLGLNFSENADTKPSKDRRNSRGFFEEQSEESSSDENDGCQLKVLW